MSVDEPHVAGGRHRYALVASYLILNITSGTVAGAMMLAVPLYAMHLKAAAAQIGLIRGISGIGILVLVIPAGFLADHYGSKRLFLTGGLLGTLATFSLVFAGGPLSIAVVMGLAGLFSTLKMTALNSSFFSNIQEIGIEKAGWFKGSMSIGLTFLGPLLGGYLASVISFRALFELLAALTLIPISLVFFFHDEPVRSSTAGEFRRALGRQWGEFRELLGRRSLYLLLFTESLTTALFSTFSAFIVVLTVQSLHLSVATASVLLSIEGALFIITVFSAGNLIKRLSQLQLYLASITVVIAGLIGLAVAGTFQSLALVTIVLGMGLGMINLVVSSSIGRMKGEKGTIVGLFTASVGLGSSLGPMLGGVIGGWLGTRSIFLSFIPVFLLLAIAVVIQNLGPSRAAASAPLNVAEKTL